MTNFENIKTALDMVQYSLSLFDNDDAKILQEGLDLWCYAPRMFYALKNVVEFLEQQGLQKSAQYQNIKELLTTIES